MDDIIIPTSASSFFLSRFVVVFDSIFFLFLGWNKKKVLFHMAKHFVGFFIWKIHFNLLCVCAWNELCVCAWVESVYLNWICRLPAIGSTSSLSFVRHFMWFIFYERELRLEHCMERRPIFILYSLFPACLCKGLSAPIIAVALVKPLDNRIRNVNLMSGYPCRLLKCRKRCRKRERASTITTNIILYYIWK